MGKVEDEGRNRRLLFTDVCPILPAPQNNRRKAKEEKRMSTRSIIGIINIDGTVDIIYCHNDGDPPHQLPILKECYNSPNKAKGLLELGDITCLGRKFSPPKGLVLGSWNRVLEAMDEKQLRDTTVAYHRDIGEPLTKAFRMGSVQLLKKRLARSSDIKWVYLYDLESGRWTWARAGKDMEFRAAEPDAK